FARRHLPTCKTWRHPFCHCGVVVRKNEIRPGFEPVVLQPTPPLIRSSASIWWGSRIVTDYAMLSSMSVLPALFKLTHAVFSVFLDGMNFIALCLRPRAALAAEILFLRKQLGLYVERKKKPRRATNSTRFTLAHLASLFDWRDVLTVVKPDTLIRWHR